MTATNHVVTGSVLAATLQNPALALPLAFILHFALDALPHFGQRNDPAKAIRRLKYILPVDAAIAAGVLLVIFIMHPERWPVIMLGGILCASPDLFQLPRYIRYLRTGDHRPFNDPLSRFHHWIQWGERPWGIYIEAAWFVGFGYVLLASL